jgi:acetyl esterase/lipase
MPIGYVMSVAVVAAGMLLALAPLGRSGRRGTVSWLLSAAVNESPFVGIWWVLAATLLAFLQGDLEAPVGWAAVGLGFITVVALPILVRRGLRAGPTVRRALDEGLGRGWRAGIDPSLAEPGRSRLPWARIVLAPIPVAVRGVTRAANLAYGPHGRRNRLDVYRRRRGGSTGPILIHLHGGHFRMGRKSFYARAMLHELARNGWLCVSANYRLRPEADFRDMIVDVKRMIAWAREHAREYGAAPTSVFVAGSSAGAHLAVTAALTENDPAFQPGFDDVDTSVAGAIGMYGYYGSVEHGRVPSSAGAYVHPDAPPILIAHGDQDTLVPPHHARELVRRLRGTSRNPVVYAELPGAQHSFDLFHSIRFATLIDGIQAFAASTCSSRATRPIERAARAG